MKNIKTIVKKEIDRVLTDKRIAFTILILPGILIFTIYSLMGNAINDLSEDIESHESVVYINDAPDSFVTYLDNYEGLNADIKYVDDTTISDIEGDILDGIIDLYIDFDENFNEVLNDYKITDAIPNINSYYNNGEDYSTSAYTNFQSILNGYSMSIVMNRLDNAEDIQPFSIDLNNDNQIIADDNKSVGNIISMLLPMLIITFLFSGTLSIGPDSIAGEKERKTIYTVLISPIKRSELAIGKIIGLSIIALISGLSSFIGVIASFPKILQIEGQDNLNIYGITDYLGLLLTIFVTVLIIVAIVSVISGFAKTTKEASALITPVYVLSLFAAMSGMFTHDMTDNLLLYLIPIYNSTQVMSGILSFELLKSGFVITICSNIFYVVLLGYLLNVIFKSEKSMFAK